MNQHQISTIVRTGRGLSISGTRVTLYSIIDYLKADWPTKLIRDRLNLTDEQIDVALAYISEHRDEVEAEYEQVVHQAEAIRQYWEAKNRERLAAIAKAPVRPEKAAMHEKLAAAKAKHSTQ